MKRSVAIWVVCLAFAGCWRQQGSTSKPGTATIAIGAAVVLFVAGRVVLVQCDQGKQPLGDFHPFGFCERT